MRVSVGKIGWQGEKGFDCSAEGVSNTPGNTAERFASIRKYCDNSYLTDIPVTIDEPRTNNAKSFFVGQTKFHLSPRTSQLESHVRAKAMAFSPTTEKCVLGAVDLAVVAGPNSTVKSVRTYPTLRY